MNPLAFNTIPTHELTVEICQIGAFDRIARGETHSKTCPYAILAQALQGRYSIGRGAERPIDLAPGEAFLTGPNIPLHITHHGDPKEGYRMRAHWIHLRITIFNSLDVTSLFDFPLRVDARRCKPFGKIMEEFQDLEHGYDNPLEPLARRQELAFRALSLLCRWVPLRQDAMDLLRQRDRLTPVLALMKERLAGKLVVADLARCANLSVPHFHLLFRRLMGRSPMDHLKHLRLSEACRLLVAGDTPLRVVAEQTGFCNEFHLSRAFRPVFGKPPGAWRRDYDGNMV